MAVRNFYAEVIIDGRRAPLTGGPQAKDGGMYIRLHQRDGGDPRLVLEITCHARSDGQLVTQVSEPRQPTEMQINTTRD